MTFEGLVLESLDSLRSLDSLGSFSDWGFSVSPLRFLGPSVFLVYST